MRMHSHWRWEARRPEEEMKALGIEIAARAEGRAASFKRHWEGRTYWNWPPELIRWENDEIRAQGAFRGSGGCRVGWRQKRSPSREGDLWADGVFWPLFGFYYFPPLFPVTIEIKCILTIFQTPVWFCVDDCCSFSGNFSINIKPRNLLRGLSWSGQFNIIPSLGADNMAMFSSTWWYDSRHRDLGFVHVEKRKIHCFLFRWRLVCKQQSKVYWIIDMVKMLCFWRERINWALGGKPSPICH